MNIVSVAILWLALLNVSPTCGGEVGFNRVVNIPYMKMNKF